MADTKTVKTADHTYSVSFTEPRNGAKRFTVRRDDRPYAAGKILDSGFPAFDRLNGPGLPKEVMREFLAFTGADDPGAKPKRQPKAMHRRQTAAPIPAPEPAPEPKQGASED